MDNDVLVGVIVNTFGIKGELKIKSSFEYQDRAFKIGNKIYIGEEKEEEIINSYRIHKNFVLITLQKYNNINEVLKYKGSNVYIKRSALNLSSDEYLYSDLIGLNVYDEDKLIGQVYDYDLSINDVLLKVKGNKTFYLPLNGPYIEKIDVDKKEIITKGGSDLIL